MRGGFRRIHTKPKFNADEVREIEHKRREGLLIKQLAALFGVGRNTINRVLGKQGAYA